LRRMAGNRGSGPFNLGFYPVACEAMIWDESQSGSQFELARGASN